MYILGLWPNKYVIAVHLSEIPEVMLVRFKIQKQMLGPGKKGQGCLAKFDVFYNADLVPLVTMELDR